MCKEGRNRERARKRERQRGRDRETERDRERDTQRDTEREKVPNCPVFVHILQSVCCAQANAAVDASRAPCTVSVGTMPCLQNDQHQPSKR